ncbi:MAG: ribose-5-phosphate isomerase [Chlamydiota bacterium]|jgi:ribose 5-phosphate isomerase A
MHVEAVKQKVGEKAVSYVKEGMLVGLGTGSTAFHFIEALIKKCKEGLKIQAIASSKRSYEQAKKGGIPMLDPQTVTSLDLVIDGADTIDAQKRMIKGGGGALVREKIVATMSREMIVIVDESKLSSQLGKCPLPVEVIPFGIQATIKQMEKKGFHGTIRMQDGKMPYITDNGNYIFDVHLADFLDHPEEEHERLIHIPGVVDTGFFFHLASKVLVGFFDGQVILK